MKTMTCSQLGGPCDLKLSGDTADDIIHRQDQHLKDAIAAGNTDHEPAHKEMKARWMHPKRSYDWYAGTKQAFADLPED